MLPQQHRSHKTPLYETHLKRGAKMVDFAGWQMPVQYPEGILKEHEANRKGVSIFDCSHMGEFILEGELAGKDLDRLLTQPVADMPVKTCRYGTMLNEQGGVIDDLIVYRLSEKEWMLVVNAANAVKNRRHILKHIARSVRFHDISTRIAKLDVQGPLSREVMLPLFPGAATLAFYTFDEVDIAGERVLVSRTGYTGELGFEIYCPWNSAKKIWDAVLADARVKPTGLGVRDVLRIEVCYPLYGHELSEEITPFEAGLGRFVDANKEFIGREALLKKREAGFTREIVYFSSENRRAPRQGHKIFTPDGVEAGEVASGTFSPALGCGIGVGFIKKEFTGVGKDIIFGDDKLRVNARTVARPFYKDGSLRK